MSSQGPIVRARPGRPRKFGRPSRPVTVTLPEDVIAQLSSVDPDLGHAIVRLVENGHLPPPPYAAAAEIVQHGRRAVIVVKPVPALKRLPGVHLVPIGNGRALIALDGPHSVPQFELDVRDALERPDLTHRDRLTLTAVAGILGDARRSRGLKLEERTIIVLNAAPATRVNRPTGQRRT